MAVTGERKTVEGYKDFWAEVMAVLEISEADSRVSDERIITAMCFVKEHLNDDVTVRDAAESVYLSEGRFSHLFREETGIFIFRISGDAEDFLCLYADSGRCVHHGSVP